jgi:hypothetical protein
VISIEQLEGMSGRLADYDVRDGGWVHEGQGLTTNLAHTYQHLSKMIIAKNFADADEVETAIAPDSLQYALRTIRWIEGNVADLKELSSGHRLEARRRSQAVGYTLEYGFVQNAAGLLEPVAHDIQHEVERQEGELKERALYAGQLLMFSAERQSKALGFDLEFAFDERILELRDRFDIQPKE